MKFVRTVIVFDRGRLLDGKPWAGLHRDYTAAIRKVVHPHGNDKFVVRRKQKKLTISGAISNQWMRNGVVPIKNQFFRHLRNAGWQTERPVGSKTEIAAKLIRQESRLGLKQYPGKQKLEIEADWSAIFQERAGDFDFFSEIADGIRCVIEWETGNISSSHRSMNKLCLAMMAGLIEIGVVIVPSRLLYSHLTDRVGNWSEISPYLPLWQQIGKGVKRGLLAITIVEHDALTDDPKIPFIFQGNDGRSAQGATKLVQG